jgi:hypothetical protein
MIDKGLEGKTEPLPENPDAQDNRSIKMRYFLPTLFPGLGLLWWYGFGRNKCDKESQKDLIDIALPFYNVLIGLQSVLYYMMKH